MKKDIDLTIGLVAKFQAEIKNLASVIEKDRKAMSTMQTQHKELQERLKKKDELIIGYRSVLRELASIKKCDFVDGEFQRKVNVACGLGDGEFRKKVDVACGPNEIAFSQYLPEKISVACGEDCSSIDKTATLRLPACGLGCDGDTIEGACLPVAPSVACGPDNIQKSLERKKPDSSKNVQEIVQSGNSSAPKHDNSMTIMNINHNDKMVERDSMKIYKGFEDENEAREARRLQRRSREKQLREQTRQTRMNYTGDGRAVDNATKKNLADNYKKFNAMIITKRGSMKLYDGFEDENVARETRRVQKRQREKQLREKRKQTRQNIVVLDEGDVELSRYMTRRGQMKRTHNRVHPLIVERRMTRATHTPE